ncbi:hypothetical protein SLM93_000270 [Campylobacter upsaliensis]|nr:hypothetical protein [Campylobacter upsaliensis]
MQDSAKSADEVLNSLIKYAKGQGEKGVNNLQKIKDYLGEENNAFLEMQILNKLFKESVVENDRASLRVFDSESFLGRVKELVGDTPAKYALNKDEAKLFLENLNGAKIPKKLDIEGFLKELESVENKENFISHLSKKEDAQSRLAYLNLVEPTLKEADLILHNGKRQDYIKKFNDGKDFFTLLITEENGKRLITFLPKTREDFIKNKIDNASLIQSFTSRASKQGNGLANESITQPLFKSKEAREFLELVEGFHKLYKNDASIAKNLVQGTSEKLSTSIATSAEGAIKQKVVKGAFDPIFRLLPDKILFGLFAKQIQGGALRYHLKKALSRSLNYDDFKIKLEKELKRTNFNSNTSRLIDEFMQNLDTFNAEKEAKLAKIREEQARIKEEERKRQEAIKTAQENAYNAQEANLGNDILEPSSLKEDFGENFAGYKGKEAIEKLLEEQRGQVRGAFYKEGLGEIDLVWGEITDLEKHKGYGLAHILDKRKSEFVEQGASQSEAAQKAAEFAKNEISNIMQNGKIINKANEATRIETQDYRLILKQNWKGEPTKNKWLVTAYMKKEKGESISSSPFTKEDNLSLNSKESIAQKALNLHEKLYLKDNDTPLNVEYKIVNKDDIKPSFTLSKTQFRSQKQEDLIKKIKENFNPDLLVNIRGDLKKGNPIITKEGEVISGNHRAAALKELEGENLAKYQNAVKEAFGVELKENEMLVRVADTSEAEIRRFSAASNEGLENNLGEQGVSLFAKYQDKIKALKEAKKPFVADDVYNLKYLVNKALGESSITKENDTSKALFASLARGRNNTILKALNELEKENLEQVSKVANMFFDNAGAFYNLTHDLDLPKMQNLQNYFSDVLVSAAKADFTRAEDFTRLNEDIRAFLDSGDKNAMLKLSPNLVSDLLAKAMGAGFARFARLENPSASLYEFLNGLKKDLLEKGAPDLFSGGKGIKLNERDEFDFAKELILKGQDSEEKFRLYQNLEELKAWKSKSSLNQPTKELKHKMLERLKPLFNQEITTKDGFKGVFNLKSLSKMTSDKAIQKSVNNGFSKEEHLRAVLDIERLFKNANLAKTYNDEKGGKNVLIHRFNSEFENANALITTKESLDKDLNKIYTLELELTPRFSDEVRPTDTKSNTGGFNSQKHTADENIATIAKTDEQSIAQKAKNDEVLEAEVIEEVGLNEPMKFLEFQQRKLLTYIKENTPLRLLEHKKELKTRDILNFLEQSALNGKQKVFLMRNLERDLGKIELKIKENESVKAKIKNTYEISQSEAKELGEHFNFKGKKPLLRELRENEIKHALKSHGNKESEEARGNIAITLQDIEANYPKITQEFDEKFFTQKGVIYVKQVNGHHIVIEEALSGQDKLIFKTMWKTKGNYNKEVLLKNAKTSPYPQNADEAVRLETISKQELEQSNPQQSHLSTDESIAQNSEKLPFEMQVLDEDKLSGDEVRHLANKIGEKSTMAYFKDYLLKMDKNFHARAKDIIREYYKIEPFRKELENQWENVKEAYKNGEMSLKEFKFLSRYKDEKSFLNQVAGVLWLQNDELVKNRGYTINKYGLTEQGKGDNYYQNLALEYGKAQTALKKWFYYIQKANKQAQRFFNKKELEDLRANEKAQKLEAKGSEDIIFTDKKGKEHTLTKETQKAWLEAFNLKSLDEEFIPNFKAEVKEAINRVLGGEEIKLTKGSLIKLIKEKRLKYLDRIKPTLENPHSVILQNDGALIFARDYGEEKYFTSVARNDSGEWIIRSNAPKSKNGLNNKILNGGKEIYNDQAASQINASNPYDDIANSNIKLDNESIAENADYLELVKEYGEENAKSIIKQKILGENIAQVLENEEEKFIYKKGDREFEFKIKDTMGQFEMQYDELNLKSDLNKSFLKALNKLKIGYEVLENEPVRIRYFKQEAKERKPKETKPSADKTLGQIQKDMSARLKELKAQAKENYERYKNEDKALQKELTNTKDLFKAFEKEFNETEGTILISRAKRRKNDAEGKVETSVFLGNELALRNALDRWERYSGYSEENALEVKERLELLRSYVKRLEKHREDIKAKREQLEQDYQQNEAARSKEMGVIGNYNILSNLKGVSENELYEPFLEKVGGYLSKADFYERHLPFAREEFQKLFNITPLEEFGTNYAEFYRDGKGAVEKLLAEKQGQVAGAFYKEGLGEIDLVWGEAGSGKSDGFGLAKIVKYHPEVIDKLDDIIANTSIVKESDNRYHLENENYKLAIRKDFEGKKTNWLLTAFEKKDSIARRRTDLPSTQSEAEKTTSANANEIIPQEIEQAEIKKLLEEYGEQISSNYPQETARLILEQNKNDGIVLSGFKIKGKSYDPEIEAMQFKTKKAEREFESLMKSYDIKGDFLNFKEAYSFKPNDEAFLQYLAKYEGDENAKLALAYNLAKQLVMRRGGGRAEVYTTDFLRQMHILENQNSTTLHSNPHLGAGLVGGTLNGVEQDENGNLSFDPVKFAAGFLGGSVGSFALKKGFQILEKNPELKEKIINELADTLAQGFEKAREKYSLLNLLEPRYIVQNEKGRKIQAKTMLKELEREQKGLYNVAFNGKNAVLIKKDLEAVDEAILFEKGTKRKGGKHIRLAHSTEPSQEGYVTKQEVANLGVNIREYLKNYEPFIDKNGARLYEWKDENGVKFRAVVNNTQTSGGNSHLPSASEEIITFYSDRNLKEKMNFKNPLLKDTIAQASMQGEALSKDLEKSFLDESGRIAYKSLMQNAEKLPKELNLRAFREQFKGQKYAIIKTPIKDVKINTDYAFYHLLKSGNGKENRKYISGGILATLQNPLFVTKDERGSYYFYKPFKINENLINLVSVEVDKNDKLLYKTSYEASKNKLKSMIEKYDLIYFAGGIQPVRAE